MPLVDRADSVLVVVDVQAGFLAHDGLSDGERAAAAAALERAIWIGGIAGILGIPAVVTEEDAQRNGATEPRLTQRLPAGTPVFAKPSFGLAACADIVAAIERTGRGTAVLVGLETDVCVAQSAIGLHHEHGLRAVVLEDASYSPGGAHERGLARMAQAGVERNHVKGIAYEWTRTVADARATFARSAERYGAPPLQL